jgi:allantoicase
MSEVEKLKKKLQKIEAELEGCRTSVLMDGWQTMRYAKKARKWDVLAQEKMAIIEKLEQYEQ